MIFAGSCKNKSSPYYLARTEEYQVAEDEPEDENIFQSEHRYTCGLARMFQNSSGDLYNETSLTCLWSRQYDTTAFDPCVWTHCIHPPEVKCVIVL